jgi:hypothetical protein
VKEGSRVLEGVSLITSGEAKGHGYSVGADVVNRLVELAQGAQLLTTIDHSESMRDYIGITRNVIAEDVTLEDGTKVRVARGDTELDKGELEDKLLNLARVAPERLAHSVEFDVNEWDGKSAPKPEQMSNFNITSLVQRPALNDRGLYVSIAGKKVLFSANYIDESPKKEQDIAMPTIALTAKSARELVKRCREVVYAKKGSAEILAAAQKIVTAYDDGALVLPAASSPDADKALPSLPADITGAIKTLFDSLLATLTPSASSEPVAPAPASPATVPVPSVAASAQPVTVADLATFGKTLVDGLTLALKQNREINHSSGRGEEFRDSGSRGNVLPEGQHTPEDKRTQEEHVEFWNNLETGHEKTEYYDKYLRGKVVKNIRFQKPTRMGGIRR